MRNRGKELLFATAIFFFLSETHTLTHAVDGTYTSTYYLKESEGMPKKGKGMKTSISTEFPV